MPPKLKYAKYLTVGLTKDIVSKLAKFVRVSTEDITESAAMEKLALEGLKDIPQENIRLQELLKESMEIIDEVEKLTNKIMLMEWRERVERIKNKIEGIK